MLMKITKMSLTPYGGVYWLFDKKKSVSINIFFLVR